MLMEPSGRKVERYNSFFFFFFFSENGTKLNFYLPGYFHCTMDNIETKWMKDDISDYLTKCFFQYKKISI